MLTIKNIPNEVYEVAIEKAELESWGLDRAAEAWEHQTSMRGFSDGELESAICDYLKRERAFNPYNGAYRDIDAGSWVGEE